MTPRPLNLADEAHAAHAYVDPTDPEQRPLMGVTTVIKTAMPPYLVPWAAKLTAEFAVDNKDSWSGLDRAAAVDMLKRAPDRARDQAGNKGTITHRFLELHARGEEPDEVYDAASAPYIAAGLAFLADWTPEFHWIEASVFHPELGYAGTLDFIATLPGLGVVIGDYKTSKGIYPEIGAQLAAYRYADHAVSETQERIDIPLVNGGVVVHIRGDGTYEVRPVQCNETQFEAFTHGLGIARFKTRTSGVIGPKQTPPTVTAAPDPVDPFAGLPDANGKPQPERAVVTPERVDWIEARVRRIIDAGGADRLAAGWPEHTPTIKAVRNGRDLFDVEADRIVALLVEVDALLGLAFPDELDPATPQPVAWDDPRVEALTVRLMELPDDLKLAVQVEATTVRKIPKLSSGRATEAQVAEVTDLIDFATTEASERMAIVRQHLADAGCDPEKVCRLASGGRRSRPETLTEPDVEMLAAVTEAAGTGYLSDALEATEQTSDLLLAVFNDRRHALTATKRAAKTAGVTPPRSFADILGDPILIALAVREAATTPVAV